MLTEAYSTAATLNSQLIDTVQNKQISMIKSTIMGCLVNHAYFGKKKANKQDRVALIML